MRCSALGTRFFAVTILGLALGAFMAAGCGGSGGAAATPAATGADVSSLTTIPTGDLSAYDTTESATSASISAAGKSLAAKEVPGAIGAGKQCRACCEANMQKQTIFRSSVMAQQMRCIAEAFQSAGLITAGTDAYNIYSMTKPDDSAEDRAKKCADIPAERTVEKEACEGGDEGPEGGVLMRLGVFGGTELRVDVCKLNPTPAHQNEGTYSLSGGTATTDVIHIGRFGGHGEKMKLHSVITGMTALGTDLVPTLDSATGSAVATASMDGGFGSGTITFTRTEADSSIAVSGAFDGKVHEYNSDTDTTFTGKAYAKGGGPANSIVAKFSFTGAPPAMPLSKMIPFDIPAANLTAFLSVMSNQFGFEVNNTPASDNYYQKLFVCPNGDFKPELASNAVKPMVLAGADKTCPVMTHSGIECGTITNGIEDSGFTGKKITQTFTSVVCTADTPFYAAVNAFDLGTLTSSITPIAFTRDWDCSGTATPLNFSTLTEAQGQTLQAYMHKCNALEEKGRGNDAMGGYDCSSKDGANAINDVKNEPPSDTTRGPLDGPYAIVAETGTCQGSGVPSKLFINTNNKTEGKYCFPDNKGNCEEFTAVIGDEGPVVTGLPLEFKKGDGTAISITNLDFTGDDNGITGVTITWEKPSSCTQLYTKEAPTDFTPPTAPSEPTDFPTECVAKGLTTPQTCGDYCHSHTCTAPTPH